MITVLTNGCFDLLHAGHVDLLKRARAIGDRLIVGLNSDASVRALKGAGRPIQPVTWRESVLRELRCVDDVVVFEETNVVGLLERIKPTVWVKGGDYTMATLNQDELRQALRLRIQVVLLPVNYGVHISDFVQPTSVSANEIIGNT